MYMYMLTSQTHNINEKTNAIKVEISLKGWQLSIIQFLGYASASAQVEENKGVSELGWYKVFPLG
jgi:hypothetical protein